MAGQEKDQANGKPSGSLSLWNAETTLPTRAPLDADVETDVCVVGAGITGLTAAYLLSRTHRVIVLDRYDAGAGDTGRTTAHLTSVLDRDYGSLAESFGEEEARLVAASHAAAIDFIEGTCHAERLDCSLERVDGFLVGTKEKGEEFERIAEAARRAGLAEAEVMDRDGAPAVRFARQAQFHPLRYLRGLLAALERRGVTVHGGSPVVRVHEGESPRVETARGPMVACSAVVVATHSPIAGKPAIHMRQSANRSYVIAGSVPKGSVPHALLWDTDEPYHYVRVAPLSETEETLIVGGEDHPTGVGEDHPSRYRRLEQWARRHFPFLGEVRYRWSGQLLEPKDGVGFAGADDRQGRLFYATGHSGNGMTHGTLSGVLLAGLVHSGEHLWERVYDPGRRSLAAALDMVKEGVKAVAKVAKPPEGGVVQSETRIPAGHGAVVAHNGTRVAVYRDEADRIWECSAVCTHLGCTVRWNDLERTWDCPCHGSRFDIQGRVVNGPASRDLDPARVEKES